MQFMLAIKGKKSRHRKFKMGQRKITLPNWHSSTFSKPNADGIMCFLKPKT